MSGLSIRPDGAFDLVSLGALVHRLDPGVVPFRKAAECAIHVSGGEYNVAANLAACFRLKTAIATAMVDYPIGELVAERVRALGVAPIYRHFAHDGVRGPNLATVYSDRGYGVRPPIVFYNRANEAAAELGPGDFDWARLFANGVRWFHTGGIFAALSPSTTELIVEALTLAKAAGAVTSFDLNYREKLWQVRGGAPAAARAFARIAELSDVIIGHEAALERELGLDGGTEVAEWALDPAPFFAAAERMQSRFPNVRLFASTLREVRSTNRHDFAAAAWARGTTALAPPVELDVFDRVGSGDGFAAGLFYGLLSGAGLDDAVRLGWAHGALVTTFPGDTTLASLEEVRAFAAGGSARIQR
jgi:2-dehydro-3-deoxygluconokinase